MTAKNSKNWEMKNTNGQWLKAALFFEHDQREPRQAVYTLKDEDLKHKGKTYVSLKAIYLKYNHAPTLEYEFANDHLGGWQHWEQLCKSPVVGPEIDMWREELEVKLRASSVKEVISVSKTEKGFQAARWLAESGYVPKAAGRPSKEQVEREARIQAGIKDDIDDMESRIQ